MQIVVLPNVWQVWQILNSHYVERKSVFQYQMNDPFVVSWFEATSKYKNIVTKLKMGKTT